MKISSCSGSALGLAGEFLPIFKHTLALGDYGLNTFEVYFNATNSPSNSTQIRCSSLMVT